MKWLIFSMITAPVLFLPGCTLIPKEKVLAPTMQFCSKPLS
ncbi:hypothetical protein [Chlamydia serpentis]|nr:hypothetical protein [Chlamydia serpentis]